MYALIFRYINHGINRLKTPHCYRKDICVSYPIYIFRDCSFRSELQREIGYRLFPLHPIFGYILIRLTIQISIVIHLFLLPCTFFYACKLFCTADLDLSDADTVWPAAYRFITKNEMRKNFQQKGKFSPNCSLDF